MTSILAFLFVLGVLIFVHELGHFLMARRIGVRVLTFSLGFGPKLLSFRRGDTEYCISAIPLGGYVKMAGENPEDARTGAPDEFLSKTKWQRFQVLVMGPVMNLALAVVVMAVVLYRAPGFRRSSSSRSWSAASRQTRSAQAAGSRSATASSASTTRPCRPGSSSISRSAPRRSGRCDWRIERDGKRIERQVVPAAVDKYEIGAIGVHAGHASADRRDAQSASPAPRAGCTPATSSWRPAGEANVSRERLDRADSGAATASR